MVKLYPNGAELKLIAKPMAMAIHVALNWIRLCPKEIAESSAIPPQTKVPEDINSDTDEEDESQNTDVADSSGDEETSDKELDSAAVEENPWAGQLCWFMDKKHKDAAT